jgi:hypothetical protein
MKNIAFIIPVIILIMWSCSKEPAIKPIAKFTTNIENNTLPIKTKFTIYLDQTRGDYITYFTGSGKDKTFVKDVYSTKGISVDKLDSAGVTGYTTPGEYTFTVVARSFGNWGKEELEAVDSIKITAY